MNQIQDSLASTMTTKCIAQNVGGNFGNLLDIPILRAENKMVREVIILKSMNNKE